MSDNYWRVEAHGSESMEVIDWLRAAFRRRDRKEDDYWNLVHFSEK